jgi:hypothetical protein
MELEGEAPLEGRWVDQVVGLNDVRADIAMMRTPDGHSRLELMRFHRPPAVSRAEARRRTRWAYDASCSLLTTWTTSLRACASTVPPRRRIAQYEDIYRLCFLRGPKSASCTARREPRT